ncbi:helix-turn-helix transcriptional regulator [Rhodococcus sp. BP-349]|jgi:DNA-binding transcriptional ArsR family regulator|uniref:ArsR/SmtB family transcription factor n=1 Tax=unclassified Rhodococcus (in: high G+C Gram-positive bacteria) TaxID=192944 RepID=UPI0004886D6D|nr:MULTISPECIES: metalloregulator ArsR/SmtB family transcription factor [unclassified Rhodococcus (in: high G+C Gram-positive bacteria)]KQU29475.1 ArsR family transcriptional regulator [Rhodococcus sp. Leaf225]KQU41064.1 ArsR family transcriptional regulator [Rhodococcus sp. Leaf258]MBY6540425.1 helix-turn-helix transcriptional regulator [Rhodococcus sp. BP-363]MBY6545550.1 helix-turn-helix transcriptional regulator [Rhodococcus sp. BP-369]MBY6564780.1 helix-turn-helix transcriptional regulato
MTASDEKRAHASLDHADRPDRARLEAAGDTFRMLSDPTRLHLLWTLSHGPADVTALTEETGASRTAVSQHLAKLRFVGMVETERSGRNVIYRLADGHLARLVREGLNFADHTVTGEPPHH